MKDKAIILAVDDTPESLALLVKMLTPEGYRVLPADSGELALAAVAATMPDLILLDVRMKGVSGLDVCRQLKAAEETRHIPIILISAFADVQEWVEGLRIGAADYITKPFQPEELLTRVKTHLALKLANVSIVQQAAALRQTNEQLQSELVERLAVGDELHRSLDQAERSRRAMLSAMEDQKQEKSQREAALAALQTALKENRDLLGELQHRVKNSFAMISGMISLASSAGISPETKAILKDFDSRVRSVSELYSLLYSAGSLTEVRLDEYCARIAAPLVGLAGNVTLNTEMESITMPVKEAAPIGLILTELITNAGKYAFPRGRHGTVFVMLKKTTTGALLEVRDDGIGLPAGFDFSASAGMGLNLVRSLSGQIHGSFRMENGPAGTGTRCIVEFAAMENGMK